MSNNPTIHGNSKMPVDRPGLYEIYMSKEGFEPDLIEVPVGSEVTWHNKADTWLAIGEAIPTGESVDASPYGLSGKLEPGGIFQMEFTLPGTWEYWCPQTGQTGMVQIVDYE